MLALTMPSRTAMDSAGSIAFGNERRASVCYGDPALTYERVLKDRHSRRSVRGCIFCCKAVSKRPSRRVPAPSHASALPAGWSHTCHSRASVKQMPASLSKVPAPAARPVRSPGIRIGVLSSSRRPVVRRIAVARHRARNRQRGFYRSQAFRLRRCAPPCLPRGIGRPPPAPCSSASRKPALAIARGIASSLKQR